MTPPTLRASDVRRAVAALRAGAWGVPAAGLASFARLKKWTSDTYAEQHHVSRATARRDLHALQRHGALGRLAGPGRAAGGHNPRLYFLTPFGAAVLTGQLGLPPAERIRAPRVALDAGVTGPDGLVTHKAAAKAAQDAHDVACLRLAVRYGYLTAGTPWQTRRLLRYRDADGAVREFVPDFGCWQGDWFYGIEVEGTDLGRHIVGKQRTYAAFAAALRRARGPQAGVSLLVVFTAPAVSAALLAKHERAFAQQRPAHAFGWTTLATALAAPPLDGNLGARCTWVRRDEIVRRERGQLAGQRAAYRYT